MNFFGVIASIIFASQVYGIEIENRCDEDVYVTGATSESVGSDLLGDSGATTQSITAGWFKVGGRDSINIDNKYRWILVMKNGAIISTTDKENIRVIGGCVHPTSSFKRRVTISDNGGREQIANHPVSECIWEPGTSYFEDALPAFRWFPFEGVGGDGKYTVKFDRCSPTKDPRKTRLLWKPENYSDRNFVFSWYKGIYWAFGSPVYSKRQQEQQFTARSTKDGIEIKAYNSNEKATYFLDGSERKKYSASENSWKVTGKGGWED